MNSSDAFVLYSFKGVKSIVILDKIGGGGRGPSVFFFRRKKFQYQRMPVSLCHFSKNKRNSFKTSIAYCWKMSYNKNTHIP